MPSYMKLEVKKRTNNNKIKQGKKGSFPFPASCVRLFAIAWRKCRRAKVHHHRLLAVTKDF